MQKRQTKNMSKTGILFPHQLFEQNILAEICDTIYLVEEWLFFQQYNFHKQKIVFHRASMKFYESYLLSKGINVVYIDSNETLSDIRKLIPFLKHLSVDSMEYIDTTDDWLEKRLRQACISHHMAMNKHETPMFLNSSEEIRNYFYGKSRFFQTDFYKRQRQGRHILLDKEHNPLGGKWSYDEENRLKYPKGKIPPKVHSFQPNSFHIEAVAYTQTYFPKNYGELSDDIIYPTTWEESKTWFQDFLETRFSEFGRYEDAIVEGEHILHHSVLSPMLNVGLLTPSFVVQKSLAYAELHDVPLNSLEGFIRQVIGWREFIRGVYEVKGREQRTRNFWGFTRKMPPSFWNARTGIEPLDKTIRKVLETGYCHHIERLMVIGNFMLLCEFDPDDVYRWFMELFVDAYDWVMVSNVYGMSQFSDGGIMATKPYISGSNYLMKMSDFKKGEWQQTWDSLFWRFMNNHRNFFLQNPRLGMLVNTFDKMPVAKQQTYLHHAEIFLKSLE